MRADAHKAQREWPLVAAALSIARPVGGVSALFALLALAGYLGHIEILYRPIPVGPATNPLTALSVLCLGISIGFGPNRLTRGYMWIKYLLVLAVILMTVLRLVEINSGIDLTSWITPFHKKVLLEQNMGMDNSMGGNTSIMLLFIAIALGLQSLKIPKASQIIAYIAAAIPSISFVGYLYGLDHFYGHMSILSATAGFCLALGVLSLTTDRWMLAAVLSPYIAGIVSRRQILTAFLVPMIAGYLALKFIEAGSRQTQELIALLVVTVSLFNFLMIGVSAIFQEQIDFLRRKSEAELTEMAQYDELTGLFNRRRFFELGQREVERIKRYKSELWVLMIDIDHFKNINDTAGHGVGDNVLKAISEKLSRSIRKTDIAGRIGGEEFAVLLTDTNQAGCASVAESIRANIESLEVPDWTDTHGSITVSIGCALMKPNNTLEGTLNIADKALYVAKRGGRNQVRFS